MPYNTHPFEIFDPTILRTTPDSEEQSYKFKLAILAYNITNALRGSLSRVGLENESIENNYYPVFFEYLGANNHTPEEDEIYFQSNFFAVPLARALSPQQLVFLLGNFLETSKKCMIEYEAFIEAVLENADNLAMALLELTPDAVDFDQKNTMIRQKITFHIEWAQRLKDVMPALNKGLLRLVLNQLPTIAASLRDHQLSFTHIITCHSLINVCEFVSSQPLSPELRTELDKNINLFIAQMPKAFLFERRVSAFCANHELNQAMPPENFMVFQVQTLENFFIEQVAENYDTIFNQLQENMHRRTFLPIKPYFKNTWEAFRKFQKGLKNHPSIDTYQTLLQCLEKGHQFITQETPFTCSNALNELAKELEKIERLHLISEGNPHIQVLIARFVKIPLLFAPIIGNWQTMFPNNDKAAIKLNALIDVVKRFKQLAASHHCEIAGLEDLEGLALSRASAMTCKPRTKTTLLPPEPQTANAKKIAQMQRDIALEENKARQEEKNKQRQITTKKQPKHTISSASSSQSIQKPKPADCELNPEVEALFENARNESAHVITLPWAIQHMTEALQLAKGQQKARAFVALINYRLNLVEEKYKQDILATIDRCITRIFVPPIGENGEKLPLSQEALFHLGDQQNRASSIANTHTSLLSIHETLLDIQAQIDSEQHQYPETGASVQHMRARIAEIDEHVKSSTQYCVSFLRGTRAAYEPYRKKTKSATAQHPEFREFNKVAALWVDINAVEPFEVISQAPLNRGEDPSSQAELVQEQLAVNLPVIFTDQAGKTTHIHINHPPLQRVYALFKATNGDIFLHGGSGRRGLRGFQLLPTAELDLITQDTEEVVMERLAEFAPHQATRISRLVQAQLEQVEVDISCSAEQDLALPPERTDFTLSMVWLKYCGPVENTGYMRFDVVALDPRGLEAIQANHIECVNGNLETTLDPARVRRLIKLMMQGGQLKNQEDSAFVKRAGVTRALFQGDDAVQAEGQHLPSLFHIRKLYYGLLKEAHHALNYHTNPFYQEAATRELQWLFREGDLFSVLHQPTQEDIDYYLRARLIEVLVTNNILPNNFVRHELLLTGPDFPERLIEVFKQANARQTEIETLQQATLDEKVEYVRDLLNRAQQRKGPRLFKEGPSQPVDIIGTAQRFFESQDQPNPGNTFSLIINALETWQRTHAATLQHHS